MPKYLPTSPISPTNNFNNLLNSPLSNNFFNSPRKSKTLINKKGDIISPDVPFYIELGNEKYLVQGFPNVPEEKVGLPANLLEELNIKYNSLKRTHKIGNQVNPLNDNDIIEFIQILEHVHLIEYSKLDKMSRGEFLKECQLYFNYIVILNIKNRFHKLCIKNIK